MTDQGVTKLFSTFIFSIVHIFLQLFFLFFFFYPEIFFDLEITVRLLRCNCCFYGLLIVSGLLKVYRTIMLGLLNI